MKRLYVFFLALIVFSVVNGYSQTEYVIVTSVTDTNDLYYDAAEILRDYRSAQVITFNPNDVNALLPVLTTLAPRYVAVVIRPEELHINFVRQFLMMSTLLDADPFSDFSYGYITGATGQDAIDFVNNIIYAESQNIQSYPLHVGGFAASSLNFIYTSPGDYMTYLSPASYHSMYLETNDSGIGNTYFNANTASLQNKKILDIGHNGDPHMIWLFEGGNTDPVPPVWLFDSAKIEDPAYARVGISSYDIAPLNLYPAVVFNGACHSGETKKVMVEGDIAATFGDTEWLTKFYTMSDTFSFSLALLKTGITGYFAPCGANNANDQSEDVYHAFLYDEPLGDTHKRSIDGVVMGFLGNRPLLKLYVLDDPGYGCDVLPSGTFDPDDYSGACYMLGGKANRIYFGDPMYNPFHNNHSPALEITTASIDSVDFSTLLITVNFDKPDVYEAYFPVWDKFHHGNTMIYIPVELPEWCGDINSIQVVDSSGVNDQVIYAFEEFDGKSYIHFEIDIPDDMYDEILYDITFQIGYVNTSIDDSSPLSSSVRIFPNPASQSAVITFSNPYSQNYVVRVFDINGRLLIHESGQGASKHTLDVSSLTQGIYVVEVSVTDNIVSKSKIMIAR